MDLQTIYNTYNDYVFRLAVTHLFSVGVDNIKKIDIGTAEKECLEKTPENYIMTGAFRAQLLRCAYALAQIPMWDILKFIQMNIKVDNTTVHPGVFVRFRSTSTNEEFLSCALPAETTESDLCEVEERITALKDQYKSMHGSMYNFPYRKAIHTALEENGIKAAEMPLDHTVYI